jgi:hypothetical protein
MTCIQVDVLYGTMNGNSIWDSYQVGKKPLLQSGTSPFSGKIIESIEIHELSYTVAAMIFYKDDGMQYTEDVKRYFYGEPYTQAPPRKAPNTQRG